MAFPTCRYTLIGAATPDVLSVVGGVGCILLFQLVNCFVHVPRPFEVDEAHDWGGCVWMYGLASPMAWCGSSIRQAVRLCGKRKEARPSLAPPESQGRAGNGMSGWPGGNARLLASRFSTLASGPWVAYHGNPSGLRLLPSTDYHSTAHLMRGMHTRISYSAAMTLMMTTALVIFISLLSSLPV